MGTDARIGVAKIGDSKIGTYIISKILKGIHALIDRAKVTKNVISLSFSKAKITKSATYKQLVKTKITDALISKYIEKSKVSKIIRGTSRLFSKVTDTLTSKTKLKVRITDTITSLNKNIAKISKPIISISNLRINITNAITGYGLIKRNVTKKYGELLDGIYLHWRYDEGNGTFAFDSNGKNTGTLNNCLWSNGGITFDPTVVSYVYATNNDWGPIAQGTQITYMAWVNLNTSNGAAQYIIGFPNGNNSGLYINDKRLSLMNYYSEGNIIRNVYTFSNNTISYNEWYHVAASYDRTNSLITYYINGTVGTVSTPFTGNSISGDIITGYTILPLDTELTVIMSGRASGSTIIGQYTAVNGNIKDVRVYAKALQENDVKAIYESTVKQYNVKANVTKIYGIDTDGLLAQWKFDDTTNGINPLVIGDEGVEGSKWNGAPFTWTGPNYDITYDFSNGPTKVSTVGGPYNGWQMQRIYPSPVDISTKTRVIFTCEGSGSNESIWFELQCPDWDNSYTVTIADNFVGRKTFVYPISSLGVRGTVDTTNFRIFNMGAASTGASTFKVIRLALDEGNTDVVKDDIGNNNGINSGAIYVTGKYGTALSFNGTSDYVVSNNKLNPNLTKITISLWAKLTLPTDIYPDIVSMDDNWSTTGIGGIKLQNQTPYNALRLRLRNDLATTKEGSSPSWNPDYDNWHHIVATYDGSYIRLFIDSIEQDNGTAWDGGLNYDSYVSIFRGFGGHYQGGIADDVRIYEKALSQEEITLLYNNQSRKYDVKQNITDTFISKFLSKQNISKVITSKYKILSKIIKAYSSKYLLKSNVIKNIRSIVPIIRNRVTKTFRGISLLKAKIIDNFTSKYLLKAKVTKAYSFKSIIKKLIIDTFTSKYLTKVNISKALSYKQLLKTNIIGDITSKFANRTTITKKLGNANINDGLLYYWKFNDPNGSTVAIDSCGGYNATIGPNATISNGILALDGTSLSFAKTEPYLLTSPNSIFTFAFWESSTIIDDDRVQTFFCDRDLNSQRGYIWMYTNVRSDDFVFRYYKNGVGEAGYIVTDYFKNYLNTLTHVGVVFNYGNSLLTIYRNGESIAQTVMTGVVFEPAPCSKYIGVRVNDSYPDAIKGTIDDFRIYDRELSSDEMKALYLNGEHELYNVKANVNDNISLSFLLRQNITNSISSVFLSINKIIDNFTIKYLNKKNIVDTLRLIHLNKQSIRRDFLDGADNAPVMWWKYNDIVNNDIIVDSSGNGYNGSICPSIATITDCESTIGWTASNGIVSLDSTDKVEGINCIALTITPLSIGETISIEYNRSAQSGKTKYGMEYWIKSDKDSSYFNSAKFYISDTNGYYRAKPMTFSADEWTKQNKFLAYLEEVGNKDDSTDSSAVTICDCESTVGWESNRSGISREYSNKQGTYQVIQHVPVSQQTIGTEYYMRYNPANTVWDWSSNSFLVMLFGICTPNAEFNYRRLRIVDTDGNWGYWDAPTYGQTYANLRGLYLPLGNYTDSSTTIPNLGSIDYLEFAWNRSSLGREEYNAIDWIRLDDVNVSSLSTYKWEFVAPDTNPFVVKIDNIRMGERAEVSNGNILSNGRSWVRATSTFPKLDGKSYTIISKVKFNDTSQIGNAHAGTAFYKSRSILFISATGVNFTAYHVAVPESAKTVSVTGITWQTDVWYYIVGVITNESSTGAADGKMELYVYKADGTLLKYATLGGWKTQVNSDNVYIEVNRWSWGCFDNDMYNANFDDTMVFFKAFSQDEIEQLLYGRIYLLKSNVIKTNRSIYKLFSEITKDIRELYNIRAKVVDNFTIKVNRMIARVSEALTSKYLLKKLITDTLTTKYLIKDSISKVLRGSYLLKAKISNIIVSLVAFNNGVIRVTLDSLNNIKANIIDTFRVVQAVRTRISDNLTAKFLIKAKIIETLTSKALLKAKIVDSLRSINKLYAKITETFTSKYANRIDLAKLFISEHLLKAKVIDSFSIKQAVRTNIINIFRVTQTIKAKITNNFVTKYLLKARISDNFTSKSNVRTNISTTLRNISKLYAIVVDNFTSKYANRINLDKSFRSIYATRTNLVKTIRALYLLRSNVIESITSKYDNIAKIAKLFTSKYLLRQRISDNITFSHLTKANITDRITSKYLTMRKITKEYGILADGLTNYWKLNEDVGTVALDSYGNMNGRLFNVTWADGGASFDQSIESYINSSSKTDWGAFKSGTQITYTAWINITGTLTPQNAEQFVMGFPWGDNSGIYISTDKHLRFKVYNNSIDGTLHSYSCISANSLPSYGSWNHVAAVYDYPNSLVTLYINGTVGNSIGTWNGVSFTTSGDKVTGFTVLPRSEPYHYIMLGKESTGYTNQYGRFNGIIKDARMYGRVLSDEEILAIYNGTSKQYNIKQNIIDTIKSSYLVKQNIIKAVRGIQGNLANVTKYFRSDEYESSIITTGNQIAYWIGDNSTGYQSTLSVLGTPILQYNSYDDSTMFSVPTDGDYSHWRMYHNYDVAQDWSNYKFIELDLTGTNSGNIFIIAHCKNSITTNVSDTGFTYWRINDNWTGNKRLLLPLDNPYGDSGNLSAVKSFFIRNTTGVSNWAYSGKVNRVVLTNGHRSYLIKANVTKAITSITSNIYHQLVKNISSLYLGLDKILVTLSQPSYKIYAKIVDTLRGTSKIYAKLAKTIVGTSNLYAKLVKILSNTNTVYQKFVRTLRGTYKTYAKITKAIRGTSKLYAKITKRISLTIRILAKLTKSLRNTNIVYANVLKTLSVTTSILEYLYHQLLTIIDRILTKFTIDRISTKTEIDRQANEVLSRVAVKETLSRDTNEILNISSDELPLDTKIIETLNRIATISTIDRQKYNVVLDRAKLIETLLRTTRENIDKKIADIADKEISEAHNA